jgi:hypothetical protein
MPCFVARVKSQARKFLSQNRQFGPGKNFEPDA